MAKHIEYWKRIDAPAYLLDVIKNGYRLPFKSNNLEPRFTLSNATMSPEDINFVTSEIESLIQTEAVSEVDAPAQVNSPLFVVRNTGKPRMIINLKRLNRALICPRFKYEDLDLVSRWIIPKGWLTKFDMKAGYHHIAIHPDHRRFLGFSWKFPDGKVKYFTFNVLPFGLSSAPYIFTKLFRPLLAYWRANQVECALYLDDGLLWAASYEEAAEKTKFVIDSLKKAGVHIHVEKSILSPVRTLTWLGAIIDLEKAEIRPTPERLKNTIQCLKVLKKRNMPTPRDRLKFTGQLASLWIVLGPRGSIYTKNMYRIICAFAFLDGGVPITSEESRELEILEDILRKPLAKSLIPPRRVFVFSSDASAIAVGVVSKDGETYSRPLTVNEKQESSTFRELLGVYFGILCFKNYIQTAEVHVYVDNQNIISILRKGSMVLKLNELAISTHEMLESLSATVIPHWIPREENELADMASRIPDRDGWAIMPHMFEKVNSELGPAEVDRFASCLNHKLPRFNSIVPSPGAEAVDAFTQDWKGVINYCVPPVDLLLPVLRFIIKHQYASILGFPWWLNLPIMPLLFDGNRMWKSYIKRVFRIPKGKVFLINDAPGRNDAFAGPFMKSDFVFVKLF